MTPRVIDAFGKNLRVAKGDNPSEVELTGERVNAVTMFDKAEDLEKGRSLQTRAFPRGTRLNEAAKTYERISIVFPDNYYAEIGLYRAGRLYELKLKDYQAAFSCYQKIVDSYPEGAYISKAKKRIKRVKKRMSKIR